MFDDTVTVVLFSVFCFYILFEVCAEEAIAVHVSHRLVGKIEHVMGYVTSVFYLNNSPAHNDHN